MGSKSYMFTGQHLLLRDTAPDDVEKPWRILTAPGGVPTTSETAYAATDFSQYISTPPTYRPGLDNMLVWDTTAAAADATKPWRPLTVTGDALSTGAVADDLPLQTRCLLRASALEESFTSAWHYALSPFFVNAGIHEVLGAVLKFQKASLSFQSSYRNPADAAPALPQPMEGANIHMTWYTGGKPAWTPAKDGYHKAKAIVDFRIRASVKTPRTDSMNSEALSRAVADSLFALLSDAASMKPLFQAGIVNIRPSQPKLATTDEWASRVINCETDLLFPAHRATLPPPAGPSWRFNDDLQLWDSAAYSSDPTKPWRGVVCTDGVLSLTAAALD
jgi:hypothetical protein